MSAGKYSMTSPANSIASSGVSNEAPKTISPTNSAKRRSVYRHEPYNNGILLVPSQDDITSQRVVYSLTSPTHRASYSGCFLEDAHNANLTSPNSVAVTPKQCNQHRRHVALSSISTDSLEGPISPNNHSSTLLPLNDFSDRNHSSHGSVDDGDKTFTVKPAPLPTPTTSIANASHVYNSHYNPRGAYQAPRALQQHQPPCLLPANLSSPCEMGVPMAQPLVRAGSVVVVAFKYGKKHFHTSFPVELNKFVVVEGDRGIDMGVVEDVVACPTPTEFHLPNVLRHPTPQDMELHRQRFQHEAEAVQRLRDMCAEQSKELNFFPEAIRDVMIQLDNKKITLIIYRENNKYFFDFRSFQRQVFELYRCRVWFSYLDEIEQTMSTDNKKPPRAPRGTFTRKGKGKGGYSGSSSAAPSGTHTPAPRRNQRMQGATFSPAVDARQ